MKTQVESAQLWYPGVLCGAYGQEGVDGGICFWLLKLKAP